MFALVDGLKIGAGAALGGAVVFGWMSLFTVPAAERAAFDAGEAHCQAEVVKEHQAELVRQETANHQALEEARQRETEQAERADDLNEQLLDLANATASDPGAADACIGPERVRDLNAIR